ncbi:MAG: 4Fe-4S dicluster domain-containing protein [Deltaproteobacteria bacterium]|nr:4Fe-4S dicluster domain-containing protein [Deltaproteobacteria bacterium]
MAIRIKKGRSGKSIRSIVQEMSDVDLSLCFQCKKCSSGCTVSGMTKSPPSEIIRRLQLGAGDEILERDIIWTCSSCETCYARCPMGIDVASVIDALRSLAIEKKAAVPEGNVPLFNKAFLKTVRAFGRAYDLAMIGIYKLGTGTFMKDTEKFPTMVMKKKIALLPVWGADRKTVRRIFKEVDRDKGK